jgi:hypothetical protein
VRVEGDGEQIAVQILKAAAPTEVITILSRPGWHWLPDPIFVTPMGEVFGAPDGAKIELAAGVQLPVRSARAGTMSGWQQAVTAAIETVNCPHWTLGVISAFVGPILALTGLDTCGVNFSGETSIGKTTAQRLFVSAWSTASATDEGLLKSMRSTENAAEVLAQKSNGTALALDEMAHADGKTIGRTIYLLAGNVGKQWMRADSTLQIPYAWRTCIVMSGETSLEEKIRGDGGQWTGGMAVRFPDIDLSNVNAAVDKSTLRSVNEISQHYGHAGPEFVRCLIECGLHREAAALKQQVLDLAAKLAGDEAKGATTRAAIPFALMIVAGELAKEFSILPATAEVREAVEFAWWSFSASSGAAVLDPDEHAIDALRAFIAERWNVTIKSIDGLHGLNNREACGWYDNDTVYLPTAHFREALGGLVKEQRFARMLRDGGLLSHTDKGRLQVKYIPNVGSVLAYALRRDHFGHQEQSTHFARSGGIDPSEMDGIRYRYSKMANVS